MIGGAGAVRDKRIGSGQRERGRNCNSVFKIIYLLFKKKKDIIFKIFYKKEGTR